MLCVAQGDAAPMPPHPSARAPGGWGSPQPPVPGMQHEVPQDGSIATLRLRAAL